jgi:uncharacterized membrane protein YjjP (DUF1212 family)
MPGDAPFNLLEETARDVRSLLEGQTTIIKLLGELMATVSSILAAQQQEKTDLGTLAGLVTKILTAVANDNLSAAQAQQILTEMQSEDSTITGLSSSINAVLNPPAPAAPAAS